MLQKHEKISMIMERKKNFAVTFRCLVMSDHFRFRFIKISGIDVPSCIQCAQCVFFFWFTTFFFLQSLTKAYLFCDVFPKCLCSKMCLVLKVMRLDVYIGIFFFFFNFSVMRIWFATYDAVIHWTFDLSDVNHIMTSKCRKLVW